LLGGLLTYVAVLIVGPSVLSNAPVLAFFAWSFLSLLLAGRGTEIGQRFHDGLNGLWGYLYLGWLPAYLLALSYGRFSGLILTVGLGVALSDVGAFCAGKALGGPKLAPRLSPSKTWGGVLGNVLGAALALALTSDALPHLLLWQQGLFTLTIALGSVWGDLLESLLKRQHGVKDAGALLPGFGGLLDRIDSLLIAAPLVYYLSLLLFG
jgi:phosphatidate cytidylyltransferase